MIDPTLITADDKNRAKGGSLRSPEFRRMVGLTWPHRRFLALGLSASIVHGFLHSITIIGVLPVLKVMLSDEGLHGWLDRGVAQRRLDVRLDISGSPEGVGTERARKVAVIVRLGRDSPLGAMGASVFDTIHRYRIVDKAADAGGGARQPAAGAEVTDALAFLEEVASAAPGAEIELTTRKAGTAETFAGPMRIKLDSPSAGWRFLRGVGSFVPRPREDGDRVTSLCWVLGAVVAVAVLSNLARFASQYYVAVGVLRSVMDLRRTLYRKVLRLPMDFFSRNTSDTVSRFVQDAQEIQRGLMALFGKMLTEPIKALFLLVWALWLDVRMTLTMLVVGPIAVVIFWAVGRKVRNANKKLLQAYGLMIGALSATLHGIGVVKAYGAENAERKRLWKIDRKMFGQQLRIAMLEAFLRPLLEMLGVLGIAAVTVWLGAQVIKGQIKLEEFATLILVLGMLVDPLRRMSDVYPRVMRSAAGSGRIYSVVDAPEEAELVEGSVDLAPLSAAIEFDKVTFSYPGAAEPALRGASLKIRKGETVALVGPNGSGKTTLTMLLVRFYDPQSGAVLFDGVDVRRARLRSLRRQISVVSQDPVVFAMSVAENIAYGKRRYDAAKVVEAARRAHADEFIRARPGAYDELLGERGTTLSGGQRQRICIARAMMRNAPVLVFDEATSQIDSESEKQIQDAIREFARGRTTILIAHRLSTIRFAQRVIVMEAGQVIDSGAHEELIERCPMYAMLCRTQLVGAEATIGGRFSR